MGGLTGPLDVSPLRMHSIRCCKLLRPSRRRRVVAMPSIRGVMAVNHGGGSVLQATLLECSSKQSHLKGRPQKSVSGWRFAPPCSAPGSQSVGPPRGGRAQPFVAAEANESSIGSNIIRNGASSGAVASNRAFAKTRSRLSCCVMFNASERPHAVSQGGATKVPQMQRANPSFNRTSPAVRLVCEL